MERQHKVYAYQADWLKNHHKSTDHINETTDRKTEYGNRKNKQFWWKSEKMTILEAL